MKQFFVLCTLLLSALCFSQTPCEFVWGPDSMLNRPEGIDFFPNGEFFAIANADGNSVTFHTVNNPSACAFVLTGPETKINYPHDVSFSPNGKWLAVANRSGNNVTIYKHLDQSSTFDSIPTAIIENKRFKGTGGVRFSPTDSIIAIASTYSNEIFIYSFRDGKVSKKPIQIIQHPSIDIADGLNFSPDGNLLAVTSHRNHKVQIFGRANGPRKGLFSPAPLFILDQEESQLLYPHSVTFSQDGHYLIVSSAGGINAASVFELSYEPFSVKTPATALLNLFDENDYLALQEINHEECGGKGISFSTDGKHILLCGPNLIDDDGVYIYEFSP